MPPAVEAQRKHFTVEEANRTLPLVRAIVSDIVAQFRKVNDLRERLAALTTSSSRRRRSQDDPYAQEMSHSEAELEAEEARLREYVDELDKLGVELKGPDGLCDFPSFMDGREIYLCWRLGESEVQFWHELQAGFDGRRPILPTMTTPRPGTRKISS